LIPSLHSTHYCNRGEPSWQRISRLHPAHDIQRIGGKWRIDTLKLLLGISGHRMLMVVQVGWLASVALMQHEESEMIEARNTTLQLCKDREQSEKSSTTKGTKITKKKINFMFFTIFVVFF
jgi:hypothetical protein